MLNVIKWLRQIGRRGFRAPAFILSLAALLSIFPSRLARTSHCSLEALRAPCQWCDHVYLWWGRHNTSLRTPATSSTCPGHRFLSLRQSFHCDQAPALRSAPASVPHRPECAVIRRQWGTSRDGPHVPSSPYHHLAGSYQITSHSTRRNRSFAAHSCPPYYPTGAAGPSETILVAL